jgi:hypothetical protein
MCTWAVSLLLCTQPALTNRNRDSKPGYLVSSGQLGVEVPSGRVLHDHGHVCLSPSLVQTLYMARTSSPVCSISLSNSCWVFHDVVFALLYAVQGGLFTMTNCMYRRRHSNEWQHSRPVSCWFMHPKPQGCTPCTKASEPKGRQCAHQS